MTPLVASTSSLEDGSHADRHAYSVSAYPVYRSLSKKSDNVVGFTFLTIVWDTFFANKLSQEADDLLVVVKNTCGQSAAFKINGGEVSRKTHSQYKPKRFPGDSTHHLFSVAR